VARILVTDDEPTVLLLVSRILERAEHVVTQATNVANGRRAYLDDNFDLVVGDCDCPEKNSGRDWLKELRAADQKVLLMSGRNVRDLGDIGDVPFIQKPFLRSDLLAKITEILSPPTA
jgi:DNA-binding response OmpR family regulator